MDRAIEYYTLAANQGCPEAQMKLDSIAGKENIGTKIDFNEPIVQIKHETNMPKCPTCNSTEIEKIGAINKVGSAAIFGVLSLGHLSKTFKCKHCGYKW